MHQDAPLTFPAHTRSIDLNRWIQIAFYGTLATLFVVALWLRGMTVALMPVDWDENYYLNIASNYIERGGLTPYMWRLDADTNIIAGSGTGYGVMLPIWWLQYVDFSFTSGRILMTAITLLNVVAVYALARAWWRTHTAGLVAGGVAAALTSSFATVYVRMDAPAVLTYTLVLWLHIVAVRRGAWWLHLLVGVAVVAAAEVHILAVLYMAALAVYYAVTALVRLWQQRNWRALLPAFWFGVGALAAGLLYVVHHILPDPQAYFIIPQDCPNCEPAGVLKEWNRYREYWNARPVEMAVGAFVIALALLRARRDDRHYLLLVGAFMVALALVSPPTQNRYMAHGWVWIALGAGGLFTANFPAWGRFAQTWRVREALVIVGVVGLLLFQGMNEFYRYQNPRFQYTLGEQRAYAASLDLPRETVILGYAPYYEDFLNYPNFMTYASGEKYGITLREETYEQFLAREAPEVLVAHVEDIPRLRTYAEQRGFVPIMEHLWVHPDLCAAGYCG